MKDALRPPPPELRRDPLSGRWVVIAQNRAGRPGTPRSSTVQTDSGVCELCEGRESATPPETFAFGPPGRAADAPGWWLRVVPNKFPAFANVDPSLARGNGFFEARPAVGNQEVVIHSPRHVTSFADLSLREIERVAAAWQERAAAAGELGFGYMHAFVNEGRAAGASLIHSHSQLLWLHEEPPFVREEIEEESRARGCLACELLEEELKHRIRIVTERDDLVLLCPYASRTPYELLVAPATCEQQPFKSNRLAEALDLLADGVRRLRLAEGDAPFNAWLHAAGHWHIEVLPRLTTMAGIELGAGYYINTLAPESAAGLLRGT